MTPTTGTQAELQQCLEEFLDAFQVPDVLLRLLAEDAARVQPVVGLLARGLTVSCYRWRKVTRAEGRLSGPDVQRLVPVLLRVETLITHPWEEADRGPLFDWLGPLFIELAFHLARELARDTAEPNSAAREGVAHCLRRCIDALRLEAPYPLPFQEGQLRGGLIEPRNLPLLLVLNEFDPGLRAEFNTAYLDYLASLTEGDPQLGAERLRDFLIQTALLYWEKTVAHFHDRGSDGDIVALANEVIPPVFNAINACDGHEPIDLVPRLLQTLKLLPLDGSRAVRNGLKGALRQVTANYLPRWRRRAESDPVFRGKFHHAMADIRPGLEGTERGPAQRHRFGYAFPVHLIPAQTESPREVPEDRAIRCEVVNLSADLSGIQFRVSPESVVASGNNIWLRFPGGGGLTEPDGCWVLIPYAEENGRERALVAEFRHVWHQGAPAYPKPHVGGQLKLISEEAEVRTCCRQISTTSCPFRPPD